MDDMYSISFYGMFYCVTRGYGAGRQQNEQRAIIMVCVRKRTDERMH